MASMDTAPVQRQLRNRNNWKRLLVPGLLAIGAALVIRWNKIHSDLALCASRVPNADIADLADLQDYRWQAQDTIFVLAHPDQDSGDFQPVLVDTRTGARKPLPALSARLGAHRLRQARYFLPSPDGKWVLLLAGKVGSSYWMAAALDGSRLVQWPVGKPDAGVSQVAWLPDSRRWICLQQGLKECAIQIYSLDSATVTERSVPSDVSKGGWFGVAPGDRIVATATVSTPPTPMPIPTRSAPAAVRSAPPQKQAVSVASGSRNVVSLPQHSGSTPAGRASAAPVPAMIGPPTHTLFLSNDTDLHFLRFALDGSVPEKRMQIKLPQEAQVVQVAFSPQADRVALLLQFLHKPPPYFWLRLLRPNLQSSFTTSMWVSRVDGSDLHMIGPEVDDEWGSPSALRWTPDGKRLSFLYKQALYTIPAD